MKIRDIVELALLYVGIPAITLYPLGFLALGIQMWRDPFFPYYDFAAVWNAVSLVPHTMVIGTGIELLYLSVISTLLGVGIASLTFHFLRRRSPGEETHRPRRSLWGLYLLVLLPIATVMALNGLTLDSPDDLWLVLGFFVFSAGGGALIGYVRVRGEDRLLLPGLGLAYAGSVLAALCIAALSSPNLPLIQIDTRVGAANDCSGPPDKMFVKLSDSQTHWFAYNPTGLFALPSDEVKVVRFQDCPSLQIQD
jgi:hypothetical protein